MKAAIRSAGLPGLLGNAIAIAMLIAVALALLTFQEGDAWLGAPRSPRWFGAIAVVVAYAGFCAWLFRDARHRDATGGIAGIGKTAIRVVYASQTGFAHQLAERTLASLRQAGMAAGLQAIDTLEADDLRHGRVLFIVSTTGEGDPPDPALGFVRRWMSQSLPLQGLQYAVLALGDRGYTHFCRFGHQLDDWLRRQGARPLFDRVDVDNADESALRHWQHHLGLLGGVTELPDWAPPRYEAWTLADRQRLNPGSAGGPVFHLTLRPVAPDFPHWQAGDIAEVGPCNSPRIVADLLRTLGWDAATEVDGDGQGARLGEVLMRSHLPTAENLRENVPVDAARALTPLPHREYSIASVPEEGHLQLLVRLMRHGDGSPGLGSGWLCEHAPVGGTILLRIRGNANFHAPPSDHPLILIGNGTGIAGLRSHLKARIAQGIRRNWLLFGERNAASDFFYREEIQAWREQGFLERLDLAFSRDQEESIYVQRKLRDAAGALRDWMAADAAIYVCGSLAGMAPGVDTALRDILGDEKVERLLIDGRYRRDVY